MVTHLVTHLVTHCRTKEPGCELALLEQRAKLGRPTAASYRPIAGDVGLLTLRKT